MRHEFGGPYRHKWGTTTSAVGPIIRRAKATKLRTSIADIRFLRASGILRDLRRAGDGSEPDYDELVELVDPDCVRLVTDVENDADPEISAKVTCGVLRSIGLNCRIRREYVSVSDLRKAWPALIADGIVRESTGPPHHGGYIRRIAVSFDSRILDFWAESGLSTTDWPTNPHPVISGLLLGYPLPDILGYYGHFGSPIPDVSVRREVRKYLAFIRAWGNSGP